MLPESIKTKSMKYTRLLLFFCMLTFGTTTLKAQDLHFTMFDMAPLGLNPAHTGAYLGTARVGGIYRSQWETVFGGYRTPSFFVDAPILAVGKRDWLGVGGMFFTDDAGVAQLKTSGFMFSGAFHHVMGKRGNSTLTLGVQGGSVTRELSTIEELLFGDQLSEAVGGGGMSMTGERLMDEMNTSYTDFSAGLMLRSQLQDGVGLELGVAVDHIIPVEYGFFGSETRPITTTAHANMTFDVSELLRIRPSLLFQTTAGTSEFALQGWAGYLFDQEKQIRLKAGLGYRLSDAGQILLGADIKDLQIGFSYDIALSDLGNEINNQGGFELAAIYIIKIYKTPQVPPSILCPEF